ncbi:MAG: hypothetical protein ABIT20_06920 [Gemmatimonadaceae bacterium]
MNRLLAVALLAAIVDMEHSRSASRDVEIVALDYAFKAPSELPAGRTTFRFVNEGKVAHEFNIVLLKPGVTMQQFMAAANADGPFRPMIDATVGVVFAAPKAKASAALSTELMAGRTYAVRCIFKDSATAPRHEQLGMFTTIHIAAGAPVVASALHVDTIVGMDYAYRYARTLSPGLHYLAFVNAGKQRHQVSLGLLKKGVTIQQVLAVAKADGDVDVLFDESLGVLHSLGGANPLGQLKVDLLPGREYMIACEFSDTPKAPPHMALGMFGSIRVTGKAAR